ncbi:MAG TPA: VOC family protein [Micromonosporaceae bacterium]|nr:VOC family protein [Micromonosporaceae bacterium]
MRGRTKDMWWGLVIEAPDPGALAGFYTQLLGWPVVEEDPDHAVLGTPQGNVFVVFQRVPDFVPPVWPGTPEQQRMTMHLDIQVEDIDAAADDAIALGAKVADFQPKDHVRVLIDPAGHPFCLCREVES